MGILDSLKGKNSSKNEEVKKDGEKIKIQFLISPTGLFGLAYNEGEIAEVEKEQALELIEAKYAKKVK